LAQRLLWDKDDHDVLQTRESPSVDPLCDRRTQSWFQVFYANAQQPSLNWDILRHEFAKLLIEEKPLKAITESDFDFITTKGTDIPLEKIQQYTQRLSVNLGSTPGGEAFINGKPIEMNGVCCIPPEYTDTRPNTTP